MVIYGAGNFGKKLLAFFDLIGLEIDYFLQSEKTVDEVAERIPVLSAELFLKEKREDIVFLAIDNEKAVNDILMKFSYSGYDLEKVFDMRSFIRGIGVHKQILPGEKKCNLCGRTFDSFMPWGYTSELFEKSKVIGGGRRKDALCPCCGSLDRTRWTYWVLQHATDLFDARCNVLHIAPEKQIRTKIETNVQCDYYPGDIEKSPGIHRVDVTHMQFADKVMDYIIINHVLEHIPDEEKAISEIKRVLKDNGKIILSFPVSLDRKTFEDCSIVTAEDRMKYYGQEDHVRLYGMDYKERIEQYGLAVKVFSPKDHLTQQKIEKYGLIPDDVLLICEKAGVDKGEANE